LLYDLYGQGKTDDPEELNIPDNQNKLHGLKTWMD